ncbi:hypothetical protein FRUB_01658 [Fimbriiglobus ruber]|uniref:Uncharacterized protein n=1 Tax=Fimbriiglobus ruber TaxID=1908690 RepID=A0A225EA88_9BACT|nr:hypothetical protein FRUB_01658 [Fimbriiglobus ruber]
MRAVSLCQKYQFRNRYSNLLCRQKGLSGWEKNRRADRTIPD